MTRPGAVTTGILTTGDVATMFGVDQRTVREWCKAGRLPHFRTPGGHRRFRSAEVTALLNGGQPERGAR